MSFAPPRIVSSMSVGYLVVIQKDIQMHIVTKQQDNVAQGRLRLKSTFDKRKEGVSTCIEVTFYQL